MPVKILEYSGNASVLTFTNMNRFEAKLAEHRLTLNDSSEDAPLLRTFADQQEKKDDAGRWIN